MNRQGPNNRPNVGLNNFSNSGPNVNPTGNLYNEPRLGEYYDRSVKLNVNTANNNNFAQNDIETNFSNKQSFNKQLSISQEPDIKYEKTDNYLVISSVDRDTTIYPSSSYFVIDLQKEYRNITEIELIQAIIPDTNNVLSEPYLLLNVKELENIMDSNNKYISESFAMLQLCPPVTSGTFIQLDKRISENVILNYRTPKARLSRMSISVTNSLGNVFEFSGTSGGDGTINKSTQSQFVFKITTLDTDRKILNQRNVY